MKQDSLNNCLIMHCHKSITDALDNVKMAKRFACAKGLLKDIVGNLSRDMRLALVFDEPPTFQTAPPPLIFHS